MAYRQKKRNNIRIIIAIQRDIQQVGIIYIIKNKIKNKLISPLPLLFNINTCSDTARKPLII